MKNILLLSFFSTLILAKSTGTVQTIIGLVEVKRNKKIITVTAGFKLEENDILMTKNKSRMMVLLNDGKLLILGSKTLLSISKYLSDVNDSKEKIIDFYTLFLTNQMEAK
jgi:hypothetical protein